MTHNPYVKNLTSVCIILNDSFSRSHVLVAFGTKMVLHILHKCFENQHVTFNKTQNVDDKIVLETVLGVIGSECRHFIVISVLFNSLSFLVTLSMPCLWNASYCQDVTIASLWLCHWINKKHMHHVILSCKSGCGKNVAGRAQFCFAATIVVLLSLCHPAGSGNKWDWTLKARPHAVQLSAHMDSVDFMRWSATWILLSHPKPPTENKIEKIHTVSKKISGDGRENRTKWHSGSGIPS